MKFTDHGCACYNLTYFEYVVHVMTGNGSYIVNMLGMGKLVKTTWMNNLFLASLVIWNQCVQGWRNWGVEGACVPLDSSRPRSET